MWIVIASYLLLLVSCAGANNYAITQSETKPNMNNNGQSYKIAEIRTYGADTMYRENTDGNFSMIIIDKVPDTLYEYVKKMPEFGDDEDAH
jgi:hypothetical protein